MKLDTLSMLITQALWHNVASPGRTYSECVRKNSLMRLFCVFLCWSLIALISARGERVYEGYTVIKGKDFGFQLKAPQGWVLDNEAAKPQGLSLVFYPSGADWGTSKAVCYVQFRSDDPTVRDIKDQVEDTLKNLRNNGSPNAEAKYIKTLTTQDASKAQIFYYTGDKFGNLEATAYIQAKNSIQFITLSAQDEGSFKRAITAFEAIVTSYENLTKVENGTTEAQQ